MTSAGGRFSGLGGVVRAVLRLVLLIGLGFGSGLLIGVVTEEPELLLGHLRGEGEAVALAPLDAEEDSRPGGEGAEGRTLADAGAAVGDEAEGTPDLGAEVGTEWEPPEVDRVALEPPRGGVAGADRRPAVSARPPGEGDSGRGVWAIQVGAFSAPESAERLSGELADKGYPVEVLPDEGGAGRWRVRVQPVDGEAAAREMAARLKREERLPTWVLSVEARPRR